MDNVSTGWWILIYAVIIGFNVVIGAAAPLVAGMISGSLIKGISTRLGLLVGSLVAIPSVIATVVADFTLHSDHHPPGGEYPLVNHRDGDLWHLLGDTSAPVVSGQTLTLTGRRSGRGP